MLRLIFVVDVAGGGDQGALPELARPGRAFAGLVRDWEPATLAPEGGWRYELWLMVLHGSVSRPWHPLVQRKGSHPLPP